jgi:hypothetical protein
MAIHYTSRRLVLAAALCAVAAAGPPASAQEGGGRRGTLVSAAPGLVTIMSNDKVLRLKFKAEQNVVTVKGKLAPEHLRAGMIVRFTGMLKGSTIDGEISDIKVYTAADGYQLGILQDAPDQPATITASLQSLKNGALTVNLGRKKITGKLGEGAAIVLETRDYSLAQRGNIVQYEGRAAVGDASTINARTIVITLNTDAGDAKEEAPAGKKAKKKSDD